MFLCLCLNMNGLLAGPSCKLFFLNNIKRKETTTMGADGMEEGGDGCRYVYYYRASITFINYFLIIIN